ncbi:MAG: TIGR00730 family Rossman fold protein [Lentisphaerae bacterium]|nr:TIGR00730 family Rossman fold protein [Lentisphaerota bacterium]MBT4823249.1 TIGR00730 family Rossman fold protein [Lentisphaerota bacterium]MBT5605662.1 TIGR00730 family Rossman fold protein [Lentisphaerota bacterium]MBT7056319.1 TIGR00730 family Rossman fold protein [Lentisphaerota bacterium]MBT7843642.1 TIGR00730 family Rossman fold protein [Lentisphaerota bacterium]
MRVCVNCGSSAGRSPAYLDEARELGAHLAAEGIELVYGGASVGLMGAVADAVLEAGGRAVGVIPKALADKVVHGGLSDLRIVDTMHERKALMFELADAFVALPGGIGTLDELFELLTWAQLGMHSKPYALLNTAGYYDGLLQFLDHTVNQRFVRPEHRQMLLVGDTVPSVLEQLRLYEPPVVEKWL